ncbi:MAG TPA: HNH endonuclease [Alphaproteobacteria bacterium]
MPVCIFCDTELTEDTKPEHILSNALGGRKTTRGVICSKHNGDFGGTIDKAFAKQVEHTRNLLQLDSGTGNAPPMLRNLKSGSDTINIRGDGTPEIVAKPFEITKRPDGNYDLKIMARSPEQLAQIVPHIAAKLGWTEERVINLIKSSTGSIISKRPAPVHLKLSFGGPEAIRSITKSCLELWALATSNEEVKSGPYDAARNFVVNGDDQFNRTRSHLDSRYLPHSDTLKKKFGELFNLIYVRSDDTGRVIGHFTLYNIISWQVVLAEKGGRPNTKIALASNPLDPVCWSDMVADDFDIEFSWLNTPDYTDEFKRAQARVAAMMQLYLRRGMESETGRIVDGVFNRVGAPEGFPRSNEEMFQQVVGEISDRAARLMLNMPHEQKLTPEEIEKMLRGVPKSRD